MEKMEFHSKSAEQTIEIGRSLVSRLQPPKLVLLRGDLGAGKTTLVKGIAEGFGAATQEEVTSPTFTLIHEYRGENRGEYRGAKATLFHIDLYRVDTERELETLGLDDLRSENSVLLVEWGEKFRRLREEADLEMALEWVSDNERRLRLSAVRVKNP